MARLSFWTTPVISFYWVKTCLLGLMVLIPPGNVCLSLVCCAVRGLCDASIPRPEEAYRMCVSLSVIRCKITLSTYNK